MAKENETIKEHTDNLVSAANRLVEYHYISDGNFIHDLIQSCLYHDTGKANKKFQERILAKINRNVRLKFNPDEEVPHNVLSVFYIEEEKCVDYNAVCFAVLYHHYRQDGNYTNYVKSNYDLICSSLENSGLDLPNKFAAIKKTKSINEVFSLPLSNQSKRYAVLLKGFLHKCDYSASAGIQCEYRNDFLLSSVEGWKNSNSVTLNPLQEFCRENCEKDIIVTAPTGMGKTEAGLLWCGDSKCFFVLPLRTAINAMYDRLKNLFGESYKDRVALIHSDMKSYYYNDNAVNESGEFDFDYCLRSRQMSLPVTVCTPDQIFDFVLKYPGYEYKLATASYSKFIIDEIQMYSPDLLAAIIYAVKLIHQMGGKFAILTATLPPFVRAELAKALGEATASADFSTDGVTRHNVKAFEKQMNSEDIASVIKTVKSESVKKFLVVCNSIDTANRLYDELSEKFKDEMPVNLFHAKFIKKDRAEKEKAIFNASKDRENSEIWISTSVVEASLDIDFDILFTELSDLFSLFQRFGRVNRKGKKSIDNTNCYVFTELQGNAKKYRFTDERVYDLSKQAVMTLDGIITEEEKSQLIETYLSVENIQGSKYAEDYRKAYNYLENLLDYEKDSAENLRTIDTVDVIPEAVYKENSAEIEEAVNILNDKTFSREEKLAANEFIAGLTVSVSRYNERQSIGSVHTKYMSVKILGNCTYSNERGVEMLKDEQKKFDSIL